MKLLGQDVIFSLAGETVAFATSCEIGTDTDFIEVCSPVSGADKEYLPTTFGWSLSGNYLCANLADKARLIELQRANTKFEVRIFDRELSTVLKGQCYIKSLQLSASKGSLAKFAATYQPTGGLEKVEMETIVPTREDTVQNVAMSADANHAYAYSKGKVIRVAQFEVQSLSRLSVAMGRGQVVLYKSNEDAPEGGMLHLMNRISDYDNLRLYAEYELAHFDYERNNNASYILKPGTYYYALDSTNKSWISMWMLESLPATN